MSTPITPRTVAKTLLRWTVRLILLALLGLVLGAIAVVVVIPRATHGEAMTVLTGSMSPTIPVGSIVEVRPVDPGTLKVGDIATYQSKTSKGSYVTHRIVKINTKTTPATFTFKGDANPVVDINPVSANQVRGKVWFHVPYLGAIRDGLHGKGGISLVAMLALGGYALSQFSGAWSDRRKPRSKSAPQTGKIDRDLLLATFDIEQLRAAHGLTPKKLASKWGAVLLDNDEQSFKLLIAPAPEGTAAALEVLRELEAGEIVTLTGPVTLTGTTPAPEPVPAASDARGQETEATHDSAR